MDITTAKTIITGLIVLAIMESAWLTVLMNKFYTEQLGGLIRTAGGRFSANILPGIGVWLLIAIGLLVFVISGQTSVQSAALHGALFGLVVYGIYDLTNMAVLREWPLVVTIVDTIWGAVLCGVTSAAMMFVRSL